MRTRDPEQLVEAAAAGDRAAVARLISLVERGGDGARAAGRLTYPRAGKAYTVGLTGAPGAGKSTITDRLLAEVRAAGSEVGVLAIDPSSPFSGGAFLGDRVRMQDHALDPGVFIRSMATRGHLGGLSLATPEAIRVLDAAGFPLVLVETVGVGQVEVEIAGSADTTVVVLNPGAGDAVQASKAGLLEVADLFVINKADRPGVGELERDLNNMLDMNMTMGEWRPPILRTVGSTGDGIAELWGVIEDHRRFLGDSGELDERRRRRTAVELRKIVVGLLEQRARRLFGGPDFDHVLDRVIARSLDPYTAAEEIVSDLGWDDPLR
ncbi:MAG: GTPase [Acidimicrobiaceae bacterium]|nr:GTPase [Acidimicrobiaceae bacterium]